MAIFLGSGLKFYDKYFWWDLLIHFLSGFTFVNFGIALSNTVDNLSNFNILLFSLTFSVFLHDVWEVGEYLLDKFFHSNNQRWQKVHASKNHISKKATQPAGLVDTMNDTILYIVGAIVSCVIWWFVL